MGVTRGNKGYKGGACRSECEIQVEGPACLCVLDVDMNGETHSLARMFFPWFPRIPKVIRGSPHS